MPSALFVCRDGVVQAAAELVVCPPSRLWRSSGWQTTPAATATRRCAARTRLPSRARRSWASGQDGRWRLVVDGEGVLIEADKAALRRRLAPSKGSRTSMSVTYSPSRRVTSPDTYWT